MQQFKSQKQYQGPLKYTASMEKVEEEGYGGQAFFRYPIIDSYAYLRCISSPLGIAIQLDESNMEFHEGREQLPRGVPLRALDQ
jgi:hypothetical protein